MKQQALTPPQPILPMHNLNQFSSGENILDEWLRHRAIKNEKRGASRTYVVCESDSLDVVAYYCLATGAVINKDAPGNIRRNMPEPIPVMVLGRLAVDQKWQGRGVGNGLLRDAIIRTVQAAKIAGIRAIVVHAISEKARQFYSGRGFQHSPVDAMTLMLRINDVEKILSQG